MTTSDFQARFPKPWHFEIHKSGFSLRAANHNHIATLNLSCSHPGIPQHEWNRHIKTAMQGYLPVVEPDDAANRKAYPIRPSPIEPGSD